MLLNSKVPRSLEKKTRLFGFELSDLLFVFLYLALSNLVFGQTKLKPVMVWGGTVALGCGLYFLKRGKPDGYVQHYGEFLYSPSVFSAATPDTDYLPFLKPETKDLDNEKS